MEDTENTASAVVTTTFAVTLEVPAESNNEETSQNMGEALKEAGFNVVAIAGHINVNVPEETQEVEQSEVEPQDE